MPTKGRSLATTKAPSKKTATETKPGKRGTKTAKRGTKTGKSGTKTTQAETPKFSAQAKLFGDYYIVEPNGSKAAIAAGYAKKGAKQQASRLLTNVDLRQYIDQGIEAKHKEIKLRGVHLIQKIEDLVLLTSDPKNKLFNVHGALKGIFYLGREQQMEFATEKHEVVTHGDIAEDILKGRERVRRDRAGAGAKT